MTHWKKCFDKEFLGSWDLEGRKSIQIRIKEVVKGEIKTDKKTDKRPIATFYKTNKKMALNATNCKVLDKLFGPEIEDWAGKWIELFVAQVDAFGDTVDAIRIRNKKVTPSPATTTAAAPDLAPERTDEETGEITEGGEE